MTTPKAALIGTVGTIVAFRIGAKDTEYIEPEFSLTNDDDTLCELQPHTAYACIGFHTQKLVMPMIGHRDFSSAPSKIRSLCKSQYAADRKAVAAKIERFISRT